MAKIDDERELIYLAISNLIKNCYESLEIMQKLPKEQYSEEDFEFVQYILNRALQVEEKLRKELDGEPITINRPNWDNLEGD